MSRMTCAVLFVLALVMLASTAALAANVGDQILPLDLKGKSRYAVVYDNADRNVDITSGPAALSKVDYDALYLRIHTDVGEIASLDLDAGGLNPSGGDVTYYVGAGFRLLVFDADAARLTAMAQVHYAPIDADKDREDASYDFVEIETGAFVSRKIKVEKQLTLMPYIGPVVSVVKLDGDAKVAGVSQDFDAEEDTLIGVAAGLTAHLRDQHSMQVEVRYFDELSFSIGVAVAF
jgi:hypothetical protein